MISALRSSLASDRRTLVGIFLLTVLGLAFRVTGIGWGVPDAGHAWPYHPDDSFPLTALRNMDFRSFNFNPGHPEGKHGFVYIMAASLAAGHVAGILHLTDDPDHYKAHPEQLSRIYIWMRLTGIAFDLAGVALGAILAERLFDKKTAWATAILGAINPARIVTCHYVTYWAIAPTLTVLAILWFLTGRGRWKPGLGAGAVTGLSISVVYLGGVPLGVAGLIALKERRFRWFCLVTIIAFVSFLLTSPYFLLDIEQTMNGFQRLFSFYGGTVSSAPASSTTANFWTPIIGVLSRVTGWPLLLFAVAGLPMMGRSGDPRNRDPRGRMLAIFTAALLCGAVMVRVSLARHASIMMPYLEISAAVAVGGLMLSRWGKACAVVLLFVTMCHSLANVAMFSSEDPRARGARWIEAHVPAGSRFAAINWFFIPHIPMTKYPMTTLWTDYPDSLAVTPHRYLLLGEGREALEERDRDPRYRRIATFAPSFPSWAGLFLSEDDPPDLRYARPTIGLFERIGRDSPPVNAPEG